MVHFDIFYLCSKYGISLVSFSNKLYMTCVLCSHLGLLLVPLLLGHGCEPFPLLLFSLFLRVNLLLCLSGRTRVLWGERALLRRTISASHKIFARYGNSLRQARFYLTYKSRSQLQKLKVSIPGHLVLKSGKVEKLQRAPKTRLLLY
jgi:hypothetical protein